MRIVSLCLFALLPLAAACGQRAPDAPWLVIHRGSEAVVSVDTSQVEFADHGAKVWLRIDQTPEQVPGEPEKTYVRVDMMDRVDCERGAVNNLGCGCGMPGER